MVLIFIVIIFQIFPVEEVCWISYLFSKANLQLYSSKVQSFSSYLHAYMAILSFAFSSKGQQQDKFFYHFFLMKYTAAELQKHTLKKNFLDSTPQNSLPTRIIILSCQHSQSNFIFLCFQDSQLENCRGCWQKKLSM